MSKQTNLLKEAIADAKTVRETAIANAKIALEEAFTPRLQSILSKRIQSEMEEEDGEPMDDEMDSMEMDDTMDVSDDAEEAGEELEDLGEEDDMESSDLEEGDEMEDELSEGDDEEMYSEEDEIESDDLDLESIIRELEDEMEDDSVEEEEIPGVGFEDPTGADDAEISEEDGEDDVDVDLDEILREMGYGEDEEEVSEEEGEDNSAELEAELEEAYSVIKSLKKTINEVNLLNAKLLYTNKLFRSYELSNEQKHKVVETLDRTTNVREVKLVFATLAESLTYGSGVAKKSKKINESFASNVVKSTAPKKQIINEEADLRRRFKELANINNKK